MEELFCISTDQVKLEWKGPPGKHAKTGIPELNGTLRVISRRTGVAPKVTCPHLAASMLDAGVGPCLYEETLYYVAAQSRHGQPIAIMHRDPLILQSLTHFMGQGHIISGSINFGSQVGLSWFTVLVGGLPEFDFEVEVFPSKMDYKLDYADMMAEISSFLTALALEYLRSTYHLGRAVKAPEPYDIEWLILLRHVFRQLENALVRISRRPRRRLHREERFVGPERIHRVDSAVRRAVLQGKGRGAYQPTFWGYIHAQVPERRAVETLDTPEHRWLRNQLLDIRTHIASLAQAEKLLSRNPSAPSARQKALLDELAMMEQRLVRLLKLEPLAQATGDPPVGFASLVLQNDDGYRQAYRACMALRLGLRMEGGPLQLSTKDISQLYEYWCYLAVVQLVGELLESHVDPKDLFRVSAKGLRVDLERGRTKKITLASGSSGQPNTEKRRITITYNPVHQSATGSQKPDVGLSLYIEGWETPFELILDAKYRLDDSPAYIADNGTPGPPVDAVNALHRYRDAILSGKPPHDRRVIFGAALFPWRDTASTTSYMTNRFYRSLTSIGIGALPFLPGQKDYVIGWLREIIDQSGWLLADKIQDHVILRERHLRSMAAQPVLILPLRGGEKELHLLESLRSISLPLRRLGPRRLAVSQIAFYLPGNGDRPGAITHEAKVLDIKIDASDQMTGAISGNVKIQHQHQEPTPGPLVSYILDSIRPLARPLPLSGGLGSFRWASTVSLKRAATAEELWLETEQEWALYDELKKAGATVDLKPLQASVINPYDIKGRAELIVADRRVRYEGLAGFRIADGTGAGVVYKGNVSAVLRELGL